jgi:hypothetical protein
MKTALTSPSAEVMAAEIRAEKAEAKHARAVADLSASRAREAGTMAELMKWRAEAAILIRERGELAEEAEELWHRRRFVPAAFGFAAGIVLATGLYVLLG